MTCAKILKRFINFISENCYIAVDFLSFAMDYSVDDLRLLVLNVGYAVHNSDWNWKDVSSPFTRLYYVTDGHAQIRMEDGVHDLYPGKLYIVPSFTRHTNICNEHFEHYYIHIYEDVQSKSKIFEEYEFPFEVAPHEGDSKLFQRLCELNPKGRLQQSNPKSYDNHSTLIENIRINKTRGFQDIVESRGILYILTSRFLEMARPKSSSKDERIRNAQSYIRKNIGSKIMVKDLAEDTSLSLEHFIRLFKKETGETPNMYITRMKLERAMVILATSDSNIKSIALTLGYDDLSYFTRAFKRFSGVTPQQYRDQHQQMK